MRKLVAAAGAVVCLAWTGAAQAADLLVGVYAHDVTFIGEAIGSGAAGREDGVDLHLGLRSDPIEALWGAPQAHAFVSINSENTSNFVAAGLSWPIGITDRLYVRPGLGLAYTDGEAGLAPVTELCLTPHEVARRPEAFNTRRHFDSTLPFVPTQDRRLVQEQRRYLWSPHA